MTAFGKKQCLQRVVLRLSQTGQEQASTVA